MNLCPPRAARGVAFVQGKDGEGTGRGLQTPPKPIWRPAEMLTSPKAWPSGVWEALAAQSGLRRGQLQAVAILKKDLQPKAGLTAELPSGTTCRMNLIA